MKTSRIREIQQLRDDLGAETDWHMAPAYAAIDDLLAAFQALQRSAGIPAEPSPYATRPACPLPEPQIRALVDAANGWRLTDQVRALNTSLETLKSRRKIACDRLGARSVTHAVAIGLCSGWITATDIYVPRSMR